MNASREDPAERSGYLRYFYLDWRPTRFGIWPPRRGQGGATL